MDEILSGQEAEIALPGTDLNEIVLPRPEVDFGTRRFDPAEDLDGFGRLGSRLSVFAARDADDEEEEEEDLDFFDDEEEEDEDFDEEDFDDEEFEEEEDEEEEEDAEDDDF